MAARSPAEVDLGTASDVAELSSADMGLVRQISRRERATEQPKGATQQPKVRQRSLSTMSGFLLKLEQDEPQWALHMCGVVVLAGAMTKTQLLALIRERMVIYRRYRSVMRKRRWLHSDAYELEDLGEDYDPEPNVIIADRSVETWDGLALYAEEVVQRPFRDDIPPWEFHLIHGFEGGKTCLLGRFSHSLGDGFTVVQIILALTENDPDGSEPNPRRAQKEQMSEGRGVLAKARFVSRVVRNTPYAILVALGWSQLLEPRSLLRFKNIGSKYAVRFSKSVDLEALKQICRPLGATVNDMVVAILGGTSRRYLEAKGAPVPAKVTTALTFNVRGTSLDAPFRESSIGNRSLCLYVPTSLDPSLELRIRTAKDVVDRLKASPIMMFGTFIFAFWSFFVGMMGVSAFMAAFIFILKRFGCDFPLAGSTICLTNVPGPAKPLTMGGVKVEAIQALVSHWNIFTVFSYNGTLRVSFTADEKNIDADLMMRCLHEEMDAVLKKAS